MHPVQMVTVIVLMLSAFVFFVTALRMALIRPKWTTGRNSQPSRMWVATMVLLFALAFVSVRDVLLAIEIASESVLGMFIRIGKLGAAIWILWASWGSGERDELVKRDEVPS